MTVRSLSLAVGLAILLSACGGIIDPSKNTVETFGGTLKVGASDAYPYSLGKTGEVEVTLTSVVPSPVNGQTIAVALGQIQGSDCLLMQGYIAAGVVNRKVEFGVLNKGSYCVIVYDPGVLTVPVTYSVRSRIPDAMDAFDSPALSWIALAIVAAIIEVSIPQFGVIFVSLGAVAGAIVAAVGLGVSAQVVVFIVALGLSLGLLRPRLMARLGAPGVPSRTDTLIGREGLVTHDIEPTVGAGRVNVGGEDWAARAPAALPAGTRIRVVAADGIVLEVTPA